MQKREFLSVQELTIEVANSTAQLWILNGVIASGAVSLISNNRMLQPRQVDANLVCPSRF